MSVLLKISFIVTAALLFAAPAAARSAVKGKAVYDRYCAWCHGGTGAGDGPAAARLNPAPRDFTLGIFKWKSTPFDEMSPSDDDFYLTIAGHGRAGFDGLPGTSMPGWSDTLGRQDTKDVAQYLKTFSGLEKNSKPPVSLKGEAGPSKDGIERGRRLYGDRCAECHGEAGRGDAAKALKDDWGGRSWPRDLTKGWTFRAGADRSDIYTRMTVGIPGTQMPSFADPASKKALTEAERWDVANYVASLDEPAKRPVAETVIRAARVDAPLPAASDDPLWGRAAYTNLFFFPQMVTGEAFAPSLDSISVKALYNGTEVALLLEWGDRTRSVPKDPAAQRMAGGALHSDAVAVQLPMRGPSGARPPYLGMGEAGSPVEIWSWKNSGEKGLPASGVFSARGTGRIKVEASRSLFASGVYDKGLWRVVMKKPLSGHDPGAAPDLEAGSFTPVAFAAWDGSNQDTKGRHVLTAWAHIYPEPRSGTGVYLWPVLAALAVFFAQFFIGFKKKPY